MTFASKTHRVAMPALLPRLRRHLPGVLAVVAGSALALSPRAVDAQRQSPPQVTTIDSVLSDGSVKAVPIPTKRGFDLFASEDIAGGTLRMTGGFRTGVVNQGGPAANNQNSTILSNHVIFGPGYSGFVFFEMGLVAGAPPSEFRKIRAVHPGINGMAGSLGYTSHYWQVLVPPQIRRIGAADGQFGKVFAGATAAFNSSCRDDPRFNVEGFSLLAMKDCPETWGSEGFKAKLVVPDSIWLNNFNANPSGFRWNDWSIAESRLDPSNTLGSQSVYGFMSDYFREQKLRYGSVVPGGSGPPVDPGYPLGLEMRMDSWQFSAPATRNTQFYQIQMVNKSADVYGTGIDYDSLYFGLGPGFLMAGAGQNASVYFDWSRNTMYAVKGGTSGNCSATYPRRYENASTAGCPATTAFVRGVYTMTLLKSPLGDMRNKFFSNPNSPYYNPASPLADDTITFNHAKANSFGQTSQNINRSMRSGFGMISSTELNYLDGRVPSDMTLANYVTLFQPENWGGAFPSVDEAKFPKFVPGNQNNPLTGQDFGKWDYNNDGVQDTIFVPTCGVQGCAELYSDTIAGGYRNSFGNILNTVSAGPFALAANDTTQFLFAFSFAPDSIGIRQAVDGAINSYMTNYEGPQPFTFPAVEAGKTYSLTSAELLDSTTFGSASSSLGAQIQIRYPQINPVDNFMVRLVNKVRADSAAGNADVRRVLRLNPGLLQRLSDRANDNLASVYVFKSCDGGTSFTTTTGNSATCVRAPSASVDGAPSAFAWLPVATVDYTNGVPATGTRTETVMAGRSYTYSFVTRSRGFSDFKIVDSTEAQGYVVTDVQATLGFPLDTINSGLATSGPSALQIYAPITNAAGRIYARVDTATLSGKASQSLIYASVSNDVTGTTRLVYGNQFIVRKAIDTLTSATTTTVNVRWVLPAASTSSAGPAIPDFVARDQSFSVDQNIPIKVGANTVPTGTLIGTSGSSRIYLDTIAAPAAYPGFAWVTGDNKPIFVTNDMYAANREREQQASPLYPGYTVVPRDTANASTGFVQELTPFGVVRDRDFTLRGPNDTLQAGAQQFVPQVAAITGAGNKRVKGGQYTLTWQTDPFGSGAPFLIDPVSDIQGKVLSSIQEATSKATTITETSAAVAALVGATTTRPLVRARVPFTLTYRDVDGRTENVRFAMLARSSNTRLLGTGNDTVRVTVPDSIWLPGDTLIALQKVERDSTVGTGASKFTVVTADGANGFRPVTVLVDSIGLNRLLVSCTSGVTGSGARPAADAVTCNPLAINTRGASPSGGYLPVGAGWTQFFELARAFDPQSVVQLVATPFTTKAVLNQADMARVSVVPNPYLARSDVDQLTNRNPTAKIYFTNVPDEGVLRIYSVSGQFLQELTWTRNDLIYQGSTTPTGDLPYNLRTREGLDMGSGLYLYVLTATGTSGNGLVQRGKFVIIR